MRLICAGCRTGKTSSGFPRTVLGNRTLGGLAAGRGCSLADMVLRLYHWSRSANPEGSYSFVDLLESSVPYSPSLHLSFSKDGRTLAASEKGIDIWDIPKR